MVPETLGKAAFLFEAEYAILIWNNQNQKFQIKIKEEAKVTEMSGVIIVFAAMLLVMFLGRKNKGGKGGIPGALNAARGNKAERNGNPNDVQQIVAQVIRFAGRRKMKLVCPGYIKFEDKISRAVLLLIGPFGVLSLRCYGYGGRVGPAQNGDEWQQDMNEKRTTIANPLHQMEEDVQIARNALRAGGFEDVPVIGAAVFTQPHVQLNVPAGCRVFDRKGLKEWMQSDALTVNAVSADLTQVAQYLTQLSHQGLEVMQAQCEQKAANQMQE